MINLLPCFLQTQCEPLCSTFLNLKLNLPLKNASCIPLIILKTHRYPMIMEGVIFYATKRFWIVTQSNQFVEMPNPANFWRTACIVFSKTTYINKRHCRSKPFLVITRIGINAFHDEGIKGLFTTIWKFAEFNWITQESRDHKLWRKVMSGILV